MNTQALLTEDPGAEESYQRPWYVVIVLKLLLVFKKLVPEKTFLRVYDWAFEFYRRLLRKNYGARAAGATEAYAVKNRMVYDSMPHSLVGWKGLEATYDAVVAVHEQDIPGDLVECGVAEGGCALLIARLAERLSTPPRKLWLFDSYEGLPEPTADDFKGGKTGNHFRPLSKGSCLGTVEQVSGLLFDEWKLSKDQIEMVKGWFEDSLPATKDRMDKIAILRLDGDWYDSTMTCFEELYDRVSSGGYVILDDYYSCFGCRRATTEFLERVGDKVEIVADGRGGSWFVKP